MMMMSTLAMKSMNEPSEADCADGGAGISARVRTAAGASAGTDVASGASNSVNFFSNRYIAGSAGKRYRRLRNRSYLHCSGLALLSLPPKVFL